MQKEKEVARLQTELLKYTAQVPTENREAVRFHMLVDCPFIDLQSQEEQAKRERDRVKWNTLMDEISKLKVQVNHSCFRSNC